jgi:hypothetical protein
MRKQVSTPSSRINRSGFNPMRFKQCALLDTPEMILMNDLILSESLEENE